MYLALPEILDMNPAWQDSQPGCCVFPVFLEERHDVVVEADRPAAADEHRDRGEDHPEGVEVDSVSVQALRLALIFSR